MCIRLSGKIRQLPLRSENDCRTVAADKRREGEAFTWALWTKEAYAAVLANASEGSAAGRERIAALVCFYASPIWAVGSALICSPSDRIQ